MASLGDRIIVLIDMDCFFCQVESRLQPALQGKPVAVVQYNQWRSGGIIAVNYEARDFGVTRHMRGDEAKEKCPDIALVSVPSLRGKADTSKYRSAGREVVDVLKKHCSIIERASVDEAYLDITELVEKRIASAEASKSELIGFLANSFVVGYCDDESNDEEQRTDGVERWINEAYAELGDVQARKLAVAGVIVEELRAEIYQISKFRCSAGISYNKILAKLACGLHKPNRQTILPPTAVPSLYATLPVKKVRNLGGKFGNIVMESLGCNVMADLMRYSLQDLQKRFDEKTGSWLFNIAKGIDNEPVTTRLVCKSIGSSKNFPGKQAIVKLDVLKHWIGELAADVSDRLEQDFEENQRRATTLTVSFQYYEDRQATSQSRSCPLKSYKAERIALQTLDAITKSTQKPIANIGIAAGKFIQSKGSGNFINFFKSNGPPKSEETTGAEKDGDEKIVDKSSKECKIVVKSELEDPEGNKSAEASSKKSDGKETPEKPKSKMESFFARKTQSRGDCSPSTTVLGDSGKADDTQNPETPKSFIAGKTQSTDESSATILGDFDKADDTETPEKPKSKMESFFASKIQNTDKSLPSTTNLGDSIKADDTETPEKPKFKIESFFARQAQNTDDKLNSGEPISPSTAILGSSQCKKALNRENLKSSFFMNFLKDSKPDVTSEMESAPSARAEDSAAHIINSTESPIKEKKNDESNDRTNQDEKSIADDNLLAQLQEIFPDLDDIDRSVVQLLPIELQRVANSYLKAKVVSKVQPVKTATKAKSKTKNPRKGKAAPNSVHNFFVKTSPNAGVDSSLQKCDECNQMIRIEKYEEHKDFHVAQNLQRIINQSTAREAQDSLVISASTESPISESSALKRRLPEDTPKATKKVKTISSFFSV